jgi:hypothetical protein
VGMFSSFLPHFTLVVVFDPGFSLLHSFKLTQMSSTSFEMNLNYGERAVVSMTYHHP